MRSAVLAIAKQEFILNWRNKWVISFSLIFAVTTLLISYFGMITSGYVGFQDFVRTAASIVNIAGFILPIFALLLGVFSFLSNREYIDLLATQAIARYKIILGKYVGLSVTLISSTLVGFALPGLIFSLSSGTEGARSYLLVVITGLTLGIVFLGIAILITLLTNRQQIALGISIAVWLFFELFYSLIVLGSTLYLSHGVLKSVLLLSLLGNPVDIVRVISFLSVGGVHFFGPAGATLLKTAGTTFNAGVIGIVGLMVWLTVPLLLSFRVFNRQNL